MSKLKLQKGGPNEIVWTREFDAPRHLVRKAMTTPELIKRWLGGNGTRATVVSAEVDLRVGGSYRYVFLRRDGIQFFFCGVYREISEERIVHTERLDDSPPDAVVTSTLTEKDGRTTLHVVISFPTPEMREMVFGTGMADGAAETYDALDGLLAEI